MHVAEAHNGEECDTVVYCAVGEERVDHVSQLGLQGKDTEIEEEDGQFDEEIGSWAGGERSHDPLTMMLDS